MTNKKRANKLAKITVASAIAFSALAQPLGTLVTVKAAEAPTTAKAENRLLTASQDIQFKNAQFTSTATSIPDWTPITFQMIDSEIKNFAKSSWTKSGSWFNIAGRSSIMPDGVGGFQIYTQGGYSGGIEQIVDTKPGEKYTISYSIQQPGVGTYGYNRVLVGDAWDASNPRTRISGVLLVSAFQPQVSFTATSTKTAVDIGLGTGTGTDGGYTTVVYRFSGLSMSNTSTTNIAAPTINTITDKDTVVTGTGTANKHVRIELADGTILTGEVGADGKYTFTIPKQSAGAVVKATLYDGAGNVSPDASTTVTASTVAPPTINTVTTDDVVVKGTGIPGQRVYYKVGSADWYEYRYATVGADGTYSFLITNQPAGTLISVKHTVGGIDSTVATTTVIQGSVAAPTINGVKSDDTTVKGTGIAGATVTITIAGQDRTATVGPGGNYSVTIPAQAVGTVITAKQTLNGKTSNPVSTTVTQGTVAEPTINPVTTDNTSVKGTGINGATVTITIGSNTYTGTVSGGEYTITIPKQAVGTVISAKQSLNNQTSGSVSTTVTQGTIADPTINPVTTDSTSVKGTGINGATVTITIGSNTYTGTVSGGEYTITIPKQAVGTVISAKQSLNNQTSGSVSTTVTQGT
ncbi:Ig-like domain-containing protein, partial [Listeria booriae]|uniref:Ig-like domain-containing protein n=2 Tax=Listeria booriae TaxID=1552123 RepID=UPI0017A4EEB5